MQDLRDPERLERMWEGRRKAAARKRHATWIAELEAAGFVIEAPEGYWGTTGATSTSGEIRIPA